MKKARYLIIYVMVSLAAFSCSRTNIKADITKPRLTNNPSWDVICTNERPLLSFFISKGGIGKRTYIMELDTSDKFNSPNLIKYENIEEENEFLASKRVEKPLLDKSRYFWRVKAKDSLGNESKWSVTRFYVDTTYNKKYQNLQRVQVKSIDVSLGFDKKNLIDYSDPGQVTFWQSTPPGPKKNWLNFDLGEEKIISRIWMLSNTDSDNGWLEDFIWQKSLDGKSWQTIEKASLNNNDTFRNLIDINPIKTRYLKLTINKFKGVAPQLNCVLFYTPQKPKIPITPSGKYILIVGDQMNGYTFTQLENYIESLNLNIKTIVVPHWEISLDVICKLKNKPIGIIFSGNNADYPNLPMFEYNGLFEIIRNSNIPLLGICCGHQMLAFTYGYTFVRSMGWEDLTALENLNQVTPIKILKNDPIFKNIKNPFIAPEVHGWSIAIVPEEFELIAESTYVQAIKHKSKFIYGEQFHAEIEVPYNEAKPYLINFLKMAIEKAN
ncbi:MAG: discoidin domain-containing protein [Parachlamydiales bacterium]|nr:discoidin domain-containing protein [Parachlamydiales bacterium]